MEGWVPRMRVWTGGNVSGVVVVVGVGVLLLPAAMAAACGCSDVLVLVVKTFPHQTGSKDRVLSIGVVDFFLDFFAFFFFVVVVVFLEVVFAFRLDLLGVDDGELHFFAAWAVVADLDTV